MSFNELPATAERAAESHPPIGRSVLTAGRWAAGLRFTERGLGLLRVVILARLLTPEDFGLFGITLLVVTILDTVLEAGVEPALVQREGRLERYMDTAWTLQIVRGAFLTALLVAGAPWIGSFFETPEASALLQVLALTTLIQGLGNISVVHFQRDLDFRSRFLYLGAGTVAEFVVSVAWALVSRSPWALVAGAIAGTLTRTILSHLVAPTPVRPGFEWARARELLGFGRWVWGNRVIVLLLNEGDDVLVGKAVGAPALGLYRMAYLLASLPTTEITHVVSRVAFPAYARLRREPARLKSAFLETLRATVLLSAPLAALIAGLAEPFTRFVLGESWVPMVPAMQLLALWGLIRAIGASAGALFLGVGRPDLTTRLAAFKLIVFVPLLIPLTLRFGITGAAGAVVAAGLVANPITNWVALRVSGASLREFLRAVGPSLLGAAATLGAVLIVDLAVDADAAALVLGGVAGLLVYVGVLSLVHRSISRALEPILRFAGAVR